MADLEEVITDAISDAELPETPELDASPEVEVSPEPVDQVAIKDEAPPAEPVTEPTEVESPVVKDQATAPVEGTVPAPVKEDFEKKFGIPPTSASGRENRIPYSRVKAIVGKVEKQAESFKKELDDLKPKFQDYETKVKTYEDRLGRVDRFEKVMVQEPDKFLDMLSTIPAYAQFFQAVEQAFKLSQGQPAAQATKEESDPMPQPDQDLGDGTKVYSLKGLEELNAWNRNQARKEALAEVEKTYGPLAKEWKEAKEENQKQAMAEKRYQEARVTVKTQIDEARQWPKFADNEEEIVKVLQDNPRISLEGAYRTVVFPKISTEHNKIREQVLAEIKKAPRSSAAPVQAVKASPESAGPRSLEDVISEAIKTIK